MWPVWAGGAALQAGTQGSQWRELYEHLLEFVSHGWGGSRQERLLWFWSQDSDPPPVPPHCPPRSPHHRLALNSGLHTTPKSGLGHVAVSEILLYILLTRVTSVHTKATSIIWSLAVNQDAGKKLISI